MQTAKVLETSVEEYLAGELVSEIRHEYMDGRVYAMAGGTVNHARIAGNVYALLHTHLRGRPYDVFGADLKIQVDAVNCYYYPDLSVSCDARDLASGQGQYAKYPCLIVEVLSKTTERIDLGEKLKAYQTLPSLQEYVVVDYKRPRIDIFRRAVAGWAHEILTLDDELHLHCVELRSDLPSIYAKVDFAAQAKAESGSDQD